MIPHQELSGLRPLGPTGALPLDPAASLGPQASLTQTASPPPTNTSNKSGPEIHDNIFEFIFMNFTVTTDLYDCDE